MSLLCLLLTACSDNKDDSQPPVTIEATVSAPAYEEAQDGQGESQTAHHSPVTRSWTPPVSYYLYENPLVGGLFANQRNLATSSIDVFLTEADKAEYTYHGRLSRSRDKWKLVIGKLDDIERKKYYFYGFIPRDAALSAEIAPLTNFSNGAVLTLQGMSPVTPSDVCAIIGAREGFDEDHDGDYLTTDVNGNGHYDKGTDIRGDSYNESTDTRVDRLRAGRFDVEMKAGSNYLFLLFDHLYSALRFSFTVDPTYHALRTIVLKKVELKGEVKAKYDATVTLTANDTGASPITGDVVFTPDESSPMMDYVTIFDGAGMNALDGLTLDADDDTKAVMGGIVPGDVKNFTLRCTYDVYDKKDNLVRRNCTAENQLNIRDIIKQSTMERGYYYTISLTIKPTYLNVMSEPDIDDPNK